MQTRHDLIGQFVQLRRKRSFTQARLAELSGVAQQQISTIERERAEPRIDTLLALAAALGARLVLVPAEDAGVPGSPFAGTPEDLSDQTGVDYLIVPDEDEGEV